MDMTGDAYMTANDGTAISTVGVFLTARRHVDYGRVRSAMCRAF
jgi:hypothetical protein